MGFSMLHVFAHFFNVQVTSADPGFLNTSFNTLCSLLINVSFAFGLVYTDLNHKSISAFLQLITVITKQNFLFNRIGENGSPCSLGILYSLPKSSASISLRPDDIPLCPSELVGPIELQSVSIIFSKDLISAERAEPLLESTRIFPY